MNGDNLNTNFEELFRDFSEEPSSNCWDAISHKLDVVLPNAGSTTAAQSTGGFSKFIASTIGKTVAVFSGVSLVAVALYTALNTSTPEKADTNTPPATQKTQTASATNEDPAVIPASAANVGNTPAIPTTQIESVPEMINNEAAPMSIETRKETPSKPVTTHTEEPIVKKHENPVKTTEEVAQETESEEGIDNTVTAPVPAEVVPAAPKTASSNLVFPNVITPNGDGYNDMFVITNLESVSNNRLVIIDVNGLKVFEANNYQNNWDASNVPDGAYYYVIETKVGGVAQTFYGALQIIR